MPRSTVLVVAFLVGAAALTLSWLLSGLLVGGSLLAVKGQQVVQEGEAAQEARRLAEAQARLAAARQGREGEAQAARALARVRKIRDEHKLPIAPWAEIPEPRPPKQPPRSRSPVPEQWIHNPERLPSPKRSKLAAAYAPLGLLWRGEYAKLDATLDAWHPLPREASALSPIELALAHLETVRGRRSDLARWLEARPDSYWARVLLARSLFGLSHEFRSSAFNHRLRPERMEAAMAVAQRGVDLLFEAARTAPERAYHWQTLYKYQRHLGVVDLPEDLASLPPGAPDPPQTLVLGARAPPAVPDTYLVDHLLLRRALHANPHDLETYRVWLDYSLPRWGGSLDALEGIGRWAWDTYGAADPSLVRVRYLAASKSSGAFGVEEHPFEDASLRRDLLMDLEEALERFPDSNNIAAQIQDLSRYEPPKRRQEQLERLIDHGRSRQAPLLWSLVGTILRDQVAPPRLDEAEAAYRKALSMGNLNTPLYLAVLLEERGTPEARREALQLRLMASVRGWVRNLVEIGRFLDAPPEGEADRGAAFLWWQQAALLGDVGSIEWMGKAFHEGKYVEKDPAMAEAWWRAAAARGNAKAMAWLGHTLSDPEESRAWLELAAQEGSQWAKKKLAEGDGRQ